MRRRYSVRHPRIAEPSPGPLRRCGCSSCGRSGSIGTEWRSADDRSGDALSSDFFHGIEDGFRVAVHLDVVPSLDDLPVRSDEIRGPGNAHVTASVVGLLLPYAVLVRHFMLGVGEEREGQVVLV